MLSKHVIRGLKLTGILSFNVTVNLRIINYILRIMRIITLICQTLTGTRTQSPTSHIPIG